MSKADGTFLRYSDRLEELLRRQDSLACEYLLRQDSVHLGVSVSASIFYHQDFVVDIGSPATG